MALVLGTNCGFVTVAPVVDPTGSYSGIIDGRIKALKVSSPSDAATITEIGWYCGNATPDVNFEVGLYDHDAVNDEPDARLFVDNTNAKGATEGWKTVSVDWAISSSTVYWLAVQVDNTSATGLDDGFGAGGRFSQVWSPEQTELPANWPDSPSNTDNQVLAIYAVYTTSGETSTAYMSPNSKFWG